MLSEFNSLPNLLAINKHRQEEMDRLFANMGNHPSRKDLTLLYDTATCSVAEGEALLSAIQDSFAQATKPAPASAIPAMLQQLCALPYQIRIDRKLVTYLQQEYSWG